MHSKNSNTGKTNAQSSSQQISASQQAVSRVIRERRTAKILARPGSKIEHPYADLERLNRLVLHAIQDAGFAPFHYSRNANEVAEPWRMYVLWSDECRYLSKKLPEWFADVKPNNKMPAMLSACGCLVLVFWIPQFEDVQKDEKQKQIDEEHLAATAAATQNLLLSLTAARLKTYWSSGGFFRTDEMKARLGIAKREKLLSAVFVDYGADPNEIESIAGKMNSARSEFKKWTRELKPSLTCKQTTDQ